MNGFAPAVRENVVATYRALGEGMPGTVVQRHFFGTTVTGNHSFSFCQFVAGFNFNPAQTGTNWLRKLSASHNGIWAFCLPGDTPTDIAEILESVGYVPRHTLTNMATQEPGEHSQAVALVEKDPEKRLVASMMSDLFFASSSETSRKMLALATSKAKCDLYSLGDRRNPTAAMMLSVSPSAVGMYNLCVRPSARRSGIGSSLVRHAQAVASLQNKPLVLQCSPGLVPWYQALGMVETGQVRALFGPTTA